MAASRPSPRDGSLRPRARGAWARMRGFGPRSSRWWVRQRSVALGDPTALYDRIAQAGLRAHDIGGRSLNAMIVTYRVARTPVRGGAPLTVTQGFLHGHSWWFPRSL